MSRFADHNETLIFLHIPKTGGTTLSSVVVAQYDADRIFHVCKAQPPTAPRYSRHCGPLEDLANVVTTDRAGFDCVLGHFNFGIHELLPGEYRYLTMVRDPVERVLSLHRQYIHHHTAVGTFSLADAPSLEEYLETQPAVLKNQQTLMLAGLLDEVPNSDEEVLARAMRNLDRHRALLGTLERFDESVVLMSAALGWRDVSYKIENRTDPYRTRAEPKTLALVETSNSFDRRLYTYVDGKIDSEIAAYGSGFERDLAALRGRNMRRRFSLDALHGENRRLSRRLRFLASRLLGRLFDG